MATLAHSLAAVRRNSVRFHRNDGRYVVVFKWELISIDTLEAFLYFMDSLFGW